MEVKWPYSVCRVGEVLISVDKAVTDIDHG